MPKYESIKEIMENGYKYLANALGITEDEARRAMHEELMQTEKTKRARELIEEATIKSIEFRDMLLEEIAKWDKENPNEPMQFRFEIRGTVSPKNHS